MSEQYWKKVLWEQQSFPDNYVPGSFLSALSKNSNVRPYTYWSLVLYSCAVTQHVSTIGIFLCVFARLLNRTLDPRFLVCFSTVLFIAGCFVWETLTCICSSWDQDSSGRRAKTVKAAILVFLTLMALAPILRTLTSATSSDSIWALSACLFILNVTLADYTSVESGQRVRERLSSVLSMNAAISAAVVLASRLYDDLSVFSLTLFSVQVFALSPILRHRLQAVSWIAQLALTITLSAASIALVVPLSATMAMVFVSFLFAITFVAPILLVWAQKFKNEIKGPWDAATPRVN